MSGASLDPKALRFAERTAQAREQVKMWTNVLKDQRLSACVFNLEGPLVDGFALFLGAVDHELREQGYAIVSHSHVPIGQLPGGALQVQWTFLVRATGEHAPRVMLS